MSGLSAGEPATRGSPTSFVSGKLRRLANDSKGRPRSSSPTRVRIDPFVQPLPGAWLRAPLAWVDWKGILASAKRRVRLTCPGKPIAETSPSA